MSISLENTKPLVRIRAHSAAGNPNTLLNRERTEKPVLMRPPIPGFRARRFQATGVTLSSTMGSLPFAPFRQFPKSVRPSAPQPTRTQNPINQSNSQSINDLNQTGVKNNDPYSKPLTASEVCQKPSVRESVWTEPFPTSELSPPFAALRGNGSTGSMVIPDFTLNAFLRRQTARRDDRPSSADHIRSSSEARGLDNEDHAEDPFSRIRRLNRPSSATPPSRVVEFSSSLNKGGANERPKWLMNNCTSENTSSSITTVSENDRVPHMLSNSPDEVISNSDSLEPVKRMPVTGTLTGTVFYRKSSKIEELMYCPRSKGDGMAEKATVDETEQPGEVLGLSLYEQVKKEVELHRQNKQTASPSPQPIYMAQEIGKDEASSAINSSTSSHTVVTKPPLPVSKGEGLETLQNKKKTEFPSTNGGSGLGSAVSLLSNKGEPKLRLSVTGANGEAVTEVSEGQDERGSKGRTQLFKESLSNPRSNSSQCQDRMKPGHSVDDNILGERQPGDGEEATLEDTCSGVKPTRSKSAPGARTTTTRTPQTPGPEEVLETEEANPASVDDDVPASERLAARRRPQSCAPTSGNRKSSAIDRARSESTDDVSNLVDTESCSTSTASMPRRSSLTRNRARSASVGVSRKSSQDSSTSRKASSTSEPAFIYSQFPHVPPVLHFVEEGEKVEPLPNELRKLLKWRMNSITPIVVKTTVSRSGFKASNSTSPSDELEGNESGDWIGYFGRHMRSAGFKSIREYQKVNHFPGSFQLGRKDRLWINLHKMQSKFGRKDFSFFPQTFCLPADQNLLKLVWDEGGGHKEKWIIKPPASARGNGIRVIHKWAQVPKKRSMIVQKYLANPYLINDSKFDLRIYVYVTSFDPLRIYVHEDGLVRFASQKYSNSVKSLNNRFMHLTNYSVNKFNSEYVSNADQTTCQGHKWSLKALWTYLRRNGVNSDAIWDKIKDLVVKTVISAEAEIRNNVQNFCRRRYCVHELFGFDVILDETLKPWILECNISPSLHSNSTLDSKIKGAMIKDMFNLAGYQLPDKPELMVSSLVNSVAANRASSAGPSSPLVTDRRLWNPALSVDERAKQRFFEDRFAREQCTLDPTILDRLTPADVRWLVETLDEGTRAGGFQCVFPLAPGAARYLRFFEAPVYSNLLVCAHHQRYTRAPLKGIDHLRAICRRKIHLYSSDQRQNSGPLDSRHRWGPLIADSEESVEEESQTQDSSRSAQRSSGVGDL